MPRRTYGPECDEVGIAFNANLTRMMEATGWGVDKYAKSLSMNKSTVSILRNNPPPPLARLSFHAINMGQNPFALFRPVQDGALSSDEQALVYLFRAQVPDVQETMMNVHRAVARFSDYLPNATEDLWMRSYRAASAEIQATAMTVLTLKSSQ